jgi:hypothetical protein
MAKEVSAEKHGETEATERHSKQLQALSLAHQEGEEKLKMQSQGKLDSPYERLAILASR